MKVAKKFDQDFQKLPPHRVGDTVRTSRSDMEPPPTAAELVEFYYSSRDPLQPEATDTFHKQHLHSSRHLFKFTLLLVYLLLLFNPHPCHAPSSPSQRSPNSFNPPEGCRPATMSSLLNIQRDSKSCRERFTCRLWISVANLHRV